jgi:hypothetical protein
MTLHSTFIGLALVVVIQSIQISNLRKRVFNIELGNVEIRGDIKTHQRSIDDYRKRIWSSEVYISEIRYRLSDNGGKCNDK